MARSPFCGGSPSVPAAYNNEQGGIGELVFEENVGEFCESFGFLRVHDWKALL